jgi:hypothetical protein
MKLLVLTATTALAVTATTAAGYTLTASTDTTVTAIVKAHPDNGHGTPSKWAADSFTRTMVIHDNGDGTYSLKTTDKGTFTTVKGAGTPSGAGSHISRNLTGSFTSTGTGHVSGGALVTNPATLSGKTFDDVHGTPFPSSGAWASTFFASGATVNPFDHYNFRYVTADEQWVDADTNNDGKDASAGNITGKLSSRLTAANRCRIKGTNQNRWTVSNVQGDRSRPFTYRVSYHGAWSPTATSTVGVSTSTTITTATGGYLSVHYYDGYGTSVWINARSVYSTVC